VKPDPFHPGPPGGGAPPAEPIAGVVLAAGSSSRMGTNKLFLPLGRETVLRRAVRVAAEAGLAPVVVVLGPEAERAERELAGVPCRCVVNPEHALGQSTSLRAGIAAVPAEARAAVVALADMPLVSAAMIAALVERYRGGAPLVVSEYGGTVAPPMLYDRRFFDELRAVGPADGGGCGKQVVRRHRAEVVAVPWPLGALADLDLPADYARVAAEPVPE
jgi:molybdenum cofactor cytidylyltransferase